jgi:hypothetical protein
LEEEEKEESNEESESSEENCLINDESKQSIKDLRLEQSTDISMREIDVTLSESPRK